MQEVPLAVVVAAEVAVDQVEVLPARHPGVPPKRRRRPMQTEQRPHRRPNRSRRSRAPQTASLQQLQLPTVPRSQYQKPLPSQHNLNHRRLASHQPRHKPSQQVRGNQLPTSHRNNPLHLRLQQPSHRRRLQLPSPQRNPQLNPHKLQLRNLLRQLLPSQLHQLHRARLRLLNPPPPLPPPSQRHKVRQSLRLVRQQLEPNQVVNLAPPPLLLNQRKEPLQKLHPMLSKDSRLSHRPSPIWIPW